MRQAGSVITTVVRGAQDGKTVLSRPLPRDVKAVKKRIAQAKEAIMRDGRLGDMDMRVGWKTIDAINSDRTYPLFGRSWLSAQTIADWIGPDRRGRPRNESTVRRAWSKCIKFGHIVRIRRGGRGTTDLFMLPADRASSPAQDEVLTVRVRPPDRANSHDNLPYYPKDNLLDKETAEEREQKLWQMRELIERLRAGSEA